MPNTISTLVWRGGSGANGSRESGGAGGGTLTPTLANFTLVTFSSLTRYCISGAGIRQLLCRRGRRAVGAALDAHRRLGALVDQVRRLRQEVRGAQTHFGVFETVKQIRTHLDADLVSQIAKRQAAVRLGRLRAIERHAEDRNLRSRGAGESRDCADTEAK